MFKNIWSKISGVLVSLFMGPVISIGAASIGVISGTTAEIIGAISTILFVVLHTLAEHNPTSAVPYDIDQIVDKVLAALKLPTDPNPLSKPVPVVIVAAPPAPLPSLADLPPLPAPATTVTTTSSGAPTK